MEVRIVKRNRTLQRGNIWDERRSRYRTYGCLPRYRNKHLRVRPWGGPTGRRRTVSTNCCDPSHSSGLPPASSDIKNDYSGGANHTAWLWFVFPRFNALDQPRINSWRTRTFDNNYLAHVPILADDIR